jgi:hypothetical protein
VNIEAAGVLCEAGRVQNISNLCSMETPEYLKISLHNSIDHPSQPYERIVIDSHFVRSHANTSVLKSKWVKSF